MLEDVMTGRTETQIPWVDGRTVGSTLRTTATTYPDHDAVVFPKLGLRWSWSEFDRRVDIVALALIELGIERGRHVGIWSMNAPEWAVTQFAVGRIGAVLVNINPAYRLHELEETLRAADVETLIVGAPFKGSDFVQMVETLCPEAAQASAPEWSSSRLPALRLLVAIGARPGPGWISLGEL
jgi:fatty-acyl-CoA synthase